MEKIEEFENCFWCEGERELPSVFTKRLETCDICQGTGRTPLKQEAEESEYVAT